MLLAASFMAFTVICFRNHYMIDVFAGVIMAHYSYAVLSPYMYPFFDKIMISKHMRC